ncbi:hypothetical protein [Roseateles sp. L2-2]|uniref:hypothetical protein n=1 Tax=Roseateles sp. L2-2 TaxID=3422597 RepID=UPI003D364532
MAFRDLPQPGNPHRLTVYQHLLPRRSIARFAADSGRVHVRFSAEAREGWLKPTDPLFCTIRSWDQKAEMALGKNIEDQFQPIAEALARDNGAVVKPDQHKAITDMFLLWQLRRAAAAEPVADVMAHGLTPDPTLDRDEQERLEAMGISFVRPDGFFPGRVIAGIQLLRQLDTAWCMGWHAVRWGVLRAVDCEFVVADALVDPALLPVAPAVYLAAQMPDRSLDLNGVSKINHLALRASSRYCFARDFDKCPLPNALVRAITDGR